MFPAFLVSYLISVLFQNGALNDLMVLKQISIMVLRISFASFLAYVIGQLLDILVFNRLRQLKAWWIAPSASTVLGNLVDTIIFFSVAFYQSADEYMAENWVEIAMVDYAWKIIICGLFFLPAYGLLLTYLSRRLTEK